MLTKGDLSAIDKLVSKRIREEVEAEGKNTRDELKSDVISARMRLDQQIRELGDRIKNLEIRVNNSDKNSTKSFQKLDKRFTDLIEKHLKLPPLPSQL